MVKTILDRKDERGQKDDIVNVLDLENVMDRAVAALSGGELQRFAIATLCVQEADVYVVRMACLCTFLLSFRYMFDEPSSYLDVKQRLKAAQVIRSLLAPEKYVSP